MEKIKDWFRWQFSSKEIVESIKIDFTEFCKNKKLTSTTFVDWVMPKKPFIIETSYKKKMEFEDELSKKHYKKLKKHALKLMAHTKKKKLVENRKEIFPSKFIIGVKWGFIITTRSTTIEEWRKYIK